VVVLLTKEADIHQHIDSNRALHWPLREGMSRWCKKEEQKKKFQINIFYFVVLDRSFFITGIIKNNGWPQTRGFAGDFT
jgi:hypothetical protein